MSIQMKNTCPFLEIPAEIRLRIYDFVYQRQVHIFNVAESVHWIRRFKPRNKRRNHLLRTCRIVYQEASPVLYQKIEAQIMLFPIEGEYAHDSMIGCGSPSEFDYFKYVQNVKLWLGEGQRNEGLKRELSTLPAVVHLFNSSNRIKHIEIELRVSQWVEPETANRIFQALMELRVDRQTIFDLDYNHKLLYYEVEDPDDDVIREERFESEHYHALVERLKTSLPADDRPEIDESSGENVGERGRR